MVQIHVERTISAPPDQVFAWLADPANLTTAPLLLQTVNNLTTRVGEAVSFQMSASEYSAGSLSFTVTGSDGFRGTPAVTMIRSPP